MLCVLMTFVSTSGATATRLAHFGPGAGYIVLDNVNCNGIETNLTQCGHRGFGVHNCAPSEDAGAFCSTGRLYVVFTQACLKEKEIWYPLLVHALE